MRIRRQRSVFSRLLVMQLVSLCIGLLILGMLFGFLMHKYYFGVREWNLIEQGNRLVGSLKESLVEHDYERVQHWLDLIAKSATVEFWLADGSGEVVVVSHATSPTMVMFEPKDISYVLEGNTITNKVVGPQYQRLLVILPIIDDGDDTELNVIGALVMQASLGDVLLTVNNVMRLVLISALVAGLLVCILNFSLAKSFVFPLEMLKVAALGLARGEFHQISVPSHSAEIDHLVSAFNYASNQTVVTVKKQQELDRLRKEFIANLSHELRGPLTSLKAFLELFEQPLSDQSKERYRDIMLADTLFLEHLVDDVLEISKLESEYVQLQREWLNPKDIITATLKSLEPKLGERKLTVYQELQDSDQLVMIDGYRLRQVFMNLLLNAIQFSPEQACIWIRLSYTETEFIVMIEDTGIGIPKEEIPFIWERFYKISKARSRDYNGSGLGLAIVKQIVTAHKGQVMVESVEGEGTLFTVRIPLHYAEEVTCSEQYS